MNPDKQDVEYSVMNYSDYIGGPTTGSTAGSESGPQTYMMYDIAALQHLYGANFDNVGKNLTYTWAETNGEEFINGIGQGAPVQAPGGGWTGAPGRIFETIWTGGANSTYDLSNFNDDATLDMRPGHFMMFSKNQLADLGNGHLAQGNVYNAILYNGDKRSEIDNIITGNGNDTIYGNDAGNVITAGSGNDTIHAGNGTNTIICGSGIDNVYGGAGNDTIVETEKSNYDPYDFGMQAGVDYVDHLDGGAGNNTVDFSHFHYAVTVDLRSGLAWATDPRSPGPSYQVATLANIQNVVGGQGDDEIWGNDAGNVITAGSGNDTIHCGNGTNTIICGSGIDSVIGGAGNDTIIETEKSNYDPYDFGMQAGVDYVDHLDGGAGNNTVDFSHFHYAVTVDLRSGQAWATDPRSLGSAYQVATLANIQNVVGGAGDDEFTVAGNNTIDGGAGTNTVIFHGARADYTITALADGELQVADSVTGRDGTDLLKNIQELRFSDGEFPTGIATQGHMQKLNGLNVVYADPGTSDFHFKVAGTGANVVFGNDGNDVLDASGPTDNMTILHGGAGKNTLIAGSNGTYTLDGGSGGDNTAVFAGKQSDYTIDGSPAGWPAWATVTDKTTGAESWLIRVEHLQFADGTIDTPGLPPGGVPNNVLFLDSSNPPANIGPGTDTVYIDDSHGVNPVHLNLAGSNVNLVYGGLGDKIIDASGVTHGVLLDAHSGNNVLIGGSGNDSLIGSEWGPHGGGNNWIDGGPGNDWEAGSGNGADTFVFRAGSGLDTVADFNQTVPSLEATAQVYQNDGDVIRFEGGLFADYDALVASGDMTQSGNDVVIKYTASDQVTLKGISLSQLSAKDFVFDATDTATQAHMQSIEGLATAGSGGFSTVHADPVSPGAATVDGSVNALSEVIGGPAAAAAGDALGSAAIPSIQTPLSMDLPAVQTGASVTQANDNLGAHATDLLNNPAFVDMVHESSNANQLAAIHNGAGIDEGIAPQPFEIPAVNTGAWVYHL
jgi:Ca2+-binding RTX toxin-like protein